MESEFKLNLTYKPTEAAKLIGVGVNMIYSLIHSGRIRTIKVGRNYLIPGSAIIEFLSKTD